MQADRFSLSVVVPNRNDSRYLPRCIASVLEQSVLPDELVIVDDESTDDSVPVIERAIAGCRFARLYRNPKNVGATENANVGLGYATCRYVYFLGANDFILPGMFAATRACLERFPDAGIWSAMIWLVDEDDRFLRVHRSPVISLRDTFVPPEGVRALVRRHGNWLTGQTTTYRREALLAAGGFRPELRALTDLFAAHVVASRHGASFTPRPLAVMRLHKGSFLSGTLQDERGFDAILERIRREGPGLEPPLFTEQMLATIEQRLRFSSYRSATGAGIYESAAGTGAGPLAARLLRAPEPSLRFLARLVGVLPRSVTVALLFLILRPFDLLPMLWYRFAGTAWVKLRERLRPSTPAGQLAARRGAP